MLVNGIWNKSNWPCLRANPASGSRSSLLDILVVGCNWSGEKCGPCSRKRALEWRRMCFGRYTIAAPKCRCCVLCLRLRVSETQGRRDFLTRAFRRVVVTKHKMNTERVSLGGRGVIKWELFNTVRIEYLS